LEVLHVEDYYENVKYFSLGLLKLGVKEGEKVSILGDNDPEWYWACISAQAIGAIPLGIFPDSNPSEIDYIVRHSDTTVVVAKDQEEVDKLLTVKDGYPV
jgi:long-chain acyl-CoA synthetase